MHDILSKITHILGQHQLLPKVVNNVVKSLFYGLWNFDKMINQHNLSTSISQILTKIPKKNAFIFLQNILTFLNDKWNLIDHHRINKFMQLVRYLIKQSIKINHKQTDQILLQTIFNNINQRSGIVNHITQIYFEIICQLYLTFNYQHIPTSVLPYQKLQLFQHLLQSSHSLQFFRIFIIQKIYEKYKQHIRDVMGDNCQSKILEFNQHILNIAKQQDNDEIRKNLYSLIKFMKTHHCYYSCFLQEKKAKIDENREKNKKKVITKFKKEIIKETKRKRKQKTKARKKHKPFLTSQHTQL